MNIFHKLYLTLLVVFLASCSSVSTERTNDATAISASASEPYSDYGITSNNVLYFAYDRSDINSEGRTKIRNLAEIIKSNDLSVRVEGHCDERGTREYNLALGQRRAEAVSDYFVLNGISKNRITVKSFGEEKPVAFGQDETSYSKNRRVEIN